MEVAEAIERGYSSVVVLAGEPAAADVLAAQTQLLSTPGLGMVLIGNPSGAPLAAVCYPKLTVAEGSDDPAWLHRSSAKLDKWGYAILWLSGEVHDPRTSVSFKGKLRQFVKRPLRMRIVLTQNRWRRLTFIWRIKWLAWLAGAKVDLDIDKGVIIEPGLRLEIRQGHHKMTLQNRVKLQTGVIIRLGGDLFIGRRSEMRYDVALNVKGTLTFEGRNNIARGTMVHADANMFWGWGACASEYVTILDSHHEYDGSLVHVHDQAIDAQDITIGATTLLGAKSTVMPGVSIGRTCMLAAGAVATKDIPDGYIAVGTPARALRPVVQELTHG